MAWCEVVETPMGRAIVRFSGKRPAQCRWCPSTHTALCDGPVGGGRTCDAPMCDRHRHHAGKNIDYCPNCKDKAGAQDGLFNGPQVPIEVR